MNKKSKKSFITATSFLVAFVLWTVAIKMFDVRAIGPNGSSVGFATINGFFHNLTGVNMLLYHISDWLGLVPIMVMFLFAIIGLTQLIKRKSLLKVDRDILILGAYYVVVGLVYLLFEYVVINYRPTLINGILEASYPSSTTMLVLCIIPITISQLNSRVNGIKTRKIMVIICSIFMSIMIVFRVVSGVHWLTDIIGGVLISISLVNYYLSCIYLLKNKAK